MSNIITIHLVDYYCRNCSLFYKGCPIHRVNSKEDDMACNQIFENFTGGHKDEDIKQQSGSSCGYYLK